MPKLRGGHGLESTGYFKIVSVAARGEVELAMAVAMSCLQVHPSDSLHVHKEALIYCVCASFPHWNDVWLGTLLTQAVSERKG